MNSADHATFLAAQSQANRMAQAFGDDEAPRALDGETLTQYRQRLLNKWKQFSNAWRGVDLAPFSDKALDTVERQIYSDAMAFALDPANVPENMLREIITTDHTGRRIHSFVGSPEACWGRFKMQPKLVVGWRTPGGNLK